MHGFACSWLALCSNEPDNASKQLSKTLTIAEHEGIFAYPGMLRPVAAELALLASEQNIAPCYIKRLVGRWNLVPESLYQGCIDWPWPVRVRTLGHFEVSLREDQAPLELSSHGRPLQLLAALIAGGRDPISKTVLCDQLWPDTDADKANHALDNLIYRLRKLIGTQTVLIQDNRISFDPSRIWVDTWYLESLAGHQSNPPHDPVKPARQLRQIYRGDFLAGQDEYWIKAERDRLLHSYLRTAERVNMSLMERSEFHEAVIFSEHLVSQDPVNESAYLYMMKALVAQGKHTEARRVYRRCQDALMHHLQVEPGPVIEAYAQSF
jgi:two-component SAPR family response regulator